LSSIEVIVVVGTFMCDVSRHPCQSRGEKRVTRARTCIRTVMADGT
jgi:hypothetical protein